MRRPDWPRVLVAVSLVAGMALVAQSEIQLAVAVGWPGWLAWCAAVALDAYVMAAVLARKDILPPVLVSAASVLASHAVYAAPAAWASGRVGQGHLVWPLAAACSVVPLLVTWRVHGLLERKRPQRGQSPVKPQVRAEVSQPAAQPVEVPAVVTPSRPALVPPVPTMSLDEWVEAERRRPGAQRADVLRRGAELYDVSQKTVARRWDKLTKEAAA